jgi:hypothetical protein
MTSENPSTATARRNRIIAIAAGAITVIAIVLAFASGFLGQQWNWLRPAGELLLLAELVGLVVLERHQLFEPVHEKVTGMETRIDRIDTTLSTLAETVGAWGQVTVCTSPPDVFRALTRVTREALAREQETPRILRTGGLSGRGMFGEEWQLEAEAQDYLAAYTAHLLFPKRPSESPARRWSVRTFMVFAERENFERWWKQGTPIIANSPLNLEVKVLVRSPAQAQLSPQTITDRDVVIALDDETAIFRWGVLFQGPHYATLFAQWYDDLWANTPGALLVYARSGVNQKALDQIRAELEVAEATIKRQTA